MYKAEIEAGHIVEKIIVVVVIFIVFMILIDKLNFGFLYNFLPGPHLPGKKNDSIVTNTVLHFIGNKKDI